MTKAIIISVVIILIIVFFIIQNRIFYSGFKRLSVRAEAEGGSWDTSKVTEDDLKPLPPPVIRFLKTSGIVGKRRLSFVRVFHSGTFKPGANKKFMPVKGEYLLTTRNPSFVWYGRVSLIPGLTFSALDSYVSGKGGMIVKIMGLIKVVDEKGETIDKSAFGRCIAEMCMSPSFFLDATRIRWTDFGTTWAECIVSDSGLSSSARFEFTPEGALEKFVIERAYDRGNGKSTIEKFIGVASVQKNFNGLTINTVYDGYWDLPEGKLHYVHFIIDNVEYQ
jgi:hypothetical protein